MPDTSSNNYKALWEQLKQLFFLEVDSLKLLITEKLIMLVTSIAFYAVAFIIGTCVVVFATIGIAHLLLEALAPHWVYMIIGGFYLLAGVVLVIFRRQLINDPIARFLSRVILDPPASYKKPEKP